jgi:hypothetical protein
MNVQWRSHVSEFFRFCFPCFIGLDVNVLNIQPPSYKFIGCAIAKAVSRRYLTVEALVFALVNTYGICGGQSGTGGCFSPNSSVTLVDFFVPLLYIHSYITWEMDKWSVRGPVPQRHRSHPIATITYKFH